MKGLFLGTLLFFVTLYAFSEVFFTERVDAEGAATIMRAWTAMTEAEPDGRMARFLRKPGEPGFIHDLTIDFDDAWAAQDANRRGYWDKRKKTIVVRRDLTEPQLSKTLRHEAAGHAYFDTQVPDIKFFIPPRYRIAMEMVHEIAGCLQEINLQEQNDDRYFNVPFNKKPEYDGYHRELYIAQLRLFFANHDLSSSELYEAVCNEAIMGFLNDQYYMHTAISHVYTQDYQLGYVFGQPNIEPTLDHHNAKYIANLDRIVRIYLEATLPDNITLTVDIENFLQRLLTHIDEMDTERIALGLRSCIAADRALFASLRELQTLYPPSFMYNGNIRFVEQDEALTWLDKLIDTENQPEFTMEDALRATTLYNDTDFSVVLAGNGE
jgi:hypothetical protein